MNSTEHPISQRIKIIIDNESNGRVVDFAQKLDGIPYQVISRLFKIDARSGNYPTPSTDLILSIINKFTQYDPRWIMTGEKSEDFRKKNSQNLSESTSQSTNEEIIEYWRNEYISISKKYQQLQEEHNMLLKNKLSEVLNHDKSANAS